MLIDIDPLTGVLERMEYDHATERLVTTQTRNVDHILDANTASFNDSAQSWRGEDNDFWYVGSVDEFVLWEWLFEFNKGKPADEQVRSPWSGDGRWNRYIMDKLNMDEFRKFKTAPVRL